MPRYVLRSIGGGQDIVFDREIVLVGRDRSCDHCLDSERVSRRHAVVTLTERGVHVRDLGSTNGTRVNGRRVERVDCLPGDEVAFGDIRFQLEPVLGGAGLTAVGQTVVDPKGSHE